MRNMTPKQKQAMCDRFNKLFAVGDTIHVHTGGLEDPAREVQIKGPAGILSGHTPVVYVGGGAGCVILSHVQEFNRVGARR